MGYANGKRDGELRLRKHAANSVVYDNSGSFLVVGGDDGKIRLYK